MEAAAGWGVVQGTEADPLEAPLWACRRILTQVNKTEKTPATPNIVIRLIPINPNSWMVSSCRVWSVHTCRWLLFTYFYLLLFSLLCLRQNPLSPLKLAMCKIVHWWAI